MEDSRGMQVSEGQAGCECLEVMRVCEHSKVCMGLRVCERAKVMWVVREGCLGVQHSAVIRVNRFPTYGTRARDKTLDAD